MPTSDAEPRPIERTPLARTAVRALILTPDGEVLLSRIRSPEGLVLWIAPGGGIEDGEGAYEALRRELAEEVGLTGCDIGPMLWRRHHTFDWGEWRVSQSEDYHVVHAERFDPVMSDPHEAAFTEEFRWWRLEALGETDEVIVPETLAAVLAAYLRDGPSAAPLDVEVLID